MKKKVCIIGGGFAGCAAAKYLSSYQELCEVTVIDKKKDREFLPLLPDVAGGGIRMSSARYELARLVRSRKVRYRQYEIASVDLNARSVSGPYSTDSYEYLLIASGSTSTFYGNDQIKKYALVLDSIEDAQRIQKSVLRGAYAHLIVVGGGYTGVEIATHMWRLCKTHGVRARITLIERAERILASLPDWMGSYVSQHVAQLGIEIRCNVSVDSASERSVSLSDGTCFDDALLVWSAGVSVSSPEITPDPQRTRQGRFIVDDYLRIHERCFVAGDAAGYIHNGQEARMGIQVSLDEGRCAAANIVRHMQNKALRCFRAVDLGYIVPMAHGRGCGNVLGLPVKGRMAIALHYLMCLYRSSFPHAMGGLIRDLFTRRGVTGSVDHVCAHEDLPG